MLGCWKFGRGQRLPPRRIADDHDGGLCFEPVVVVVVVVVVHGCCGYCGWCWCWCWWFWCRERREPLKEIKKLEGGWWGGRSASPPDASLTTMMVFFFSNLLLFPPLGVFRSRLLQMKYYYYCFRCWKGGVLVAVVDAPVEGRLKRVLVVHCCCGYCRWRWCWWCWCRERRQPLKKIKKLEGGWGGGRSASPPDASLTTMMVVFVLNLLLLLLLLLLQF